MTLFHNTPTRRQLVECGILIALSLLFFAYRMERWDFVAYGAILLLLSLIFPLVFYPLAYVWFGFAKVLGFVSSYILLTLLFFLLITPVGLLRRFMGKDSLQLKKFKQGRDSVLISRNGKITPTHFKNPF